MRQLFASSKLLLLDMASTFFFLAVFLLTGSIALSVALGMALGVAQVGWEFARGKPIDVMQWMSLFLVLASGTAALITADPRFVMLKPTIIYCVVGVVMLRRGWMNRYLPPAAVEWAPDIAIIFGYAWAGLMFLSAALNLIAAMQFKRHGLVGIHVGLGCRQQGRPVPDLVCDHALRRHAPPSGADVASPSIAHEPRDRKSAEPRAGGAPVFAGPASWRRPRPER